MFKKIKTKYYELFTKILLQPFADGIIDLLEIAIHYKKERMFNKYLMYGYMLNEYALNKGIYLD